MGKFTRLLRLNLKQRYGKAYVAIMATLLLLVVLENLLLIIYTPRPNHTVLTGEELSMEIHNQLLIINPIMIFIIISFALFPTMIMSLRAEADFVLTTPEDPKTIFAIGMVTESINYVLLLLIMTLPTIMLEVYAVHWYIIALYILDVLSLSILLVGISIYTQYMSPGMKTAMLALISAYLIATSILTPGLNLFYGILTGDPAYTVVYLIIASLMIIDIFRRFAQDLYVNIYGVYGSTVAQPRVTSPRPSTALPRTAWGVVWWTSTHSVSVGRIRSGSLYRDLVTTNAFRVLIPFSIAGSVVIVIATFMVPATIIKILGDTYYGMVSLFSTFYVLFFELLILGNSLVRERVWINFVNIDPTQYLRMRMRARLLVTYVGIAPPTVSLATLYVLTQYTVFLSSALTLLATPPLFVVVSWPLTAMSRIPQFIEAGLQVRPFRFNAWMFLAGIISFALLAMAMAPTVLAMLIPNDLALVISSATALLGISIATYAVLLYTRFSAALVDWLLEKLVADSGYV